VFSNGDSGNTAEIYGILEVNIGQRAQNQNIVLWQVLQSNHQVIQDGTLKEFLILHNFKEMRSFSSAASGKMVTINGNAKEDDNIGDDDLGTFVNQQLQAYSMFQKNGINKTYVGSSGLKYGYVVIKLHLVVD